MRFAAHSDVAFIKGVDQAYYRIHGAQMTTERVPIVDLHQRKAAYDALFDGYADRIPAPTGCDGGPTARWPRRPSGARAAPTTGAAWTRRR